MFLWRPGKRQIDHQLLHLSFKNLKVLVKYCRTGSCFVKQNLWNGRATYRETNMLRSWWVRYPGMFSIFLVFTPSQESVCLRLKLSLIVKVQVSVNFTALCKLLACLIVASFSRGIRKLISYFPSIDNLKKSKCQRKPKAPSHWLSESRQVEWGRKGNKENTFLCKILSLHNNPSYVHEFREGMVGWHRPGVQSAKVNLPAGNKMCVKIKNWVHGKKYWTWLPCGFFWSLHVVSWLAMGKSKTDLL